MSEIGIITNPHSKLNKRNPSRLHLLSYILGERGTFAVTHSLDDLARVATQFKSNNIKILAINGGDGTISRTLSAFYAVYGSDPLPKVALLRGGTMNVLAVNLGIKGSPERLLARLLEKVGANSDCETREIQALRVKDHLGFVYADGSITNVLEEFYKKKSGVLGALWLGLRLAVSSLRTGALFNRVITNQKLTLISPDTAQPQEVESLATLASSIKKLPLGIPLFSRVNGHACKFQVVNVCGSSRGLLWRLPRIFFTKGVGQDKISFLTDKLSIHAKSSIIYTLDGEIFECPEGQLNVELGPKVEFLKF